MDQVGLAALAISPLATAVQVALALQATQV
jgi:hypothetical protein